MSAAQVSAAPAELRAAESGGPAVTRPRELEEAAEEGGRQRRAAAVEAPPPKENPWTRRRAAGDSPSPPAADGQVVPQDPGAAAGPGPGKVVCVGGGRPGAGWRVCGAFWGGGGKVVLRFLFEKRKAAVCLRTGTGRPAVRLRGSPAGRSGF